MQSPSPFVSTGRAARLLGISAHIIRAELEAGRIKGMRTCDTGQWRVRVSDLEEWIQSRCAGGRVILTEPRELVPQEDFALTAK